MQRSGFNSDEIIKGMEVPEGWELEVHVDTSKPQEVKQFENLKRKIGLYLPSVTSRLEIFKSRALRNSHIAIQSTFIYVDADGTFEVVMHINKSDFHSPDMVGLRLDAKEYLYNLADMNMRLKFAITEEQNRFSMSRRSFMMRYSFGTPSFFRKAS